MIKEPKIAVGIMADTTIKFEFLHPFIHENTTYQAGQYKAKAVDGLITISDNANNEIGRFKQLIFIGLNDGCFTLEGVTIGINFHWEQQENQTFEGDLEFKIIDNKIEVINHILLEKYLLSVISSEMSATSNTEFLKTHAIISRSWLMAQLENSKIKTAYPKIATDSTIETWFDREDHNHFDVCADDHCQRYQGVSKASTAAVKTAIEATRGLFITHNNKVCDARFYKCCGGATEQFEDVWQPTPHSYLTKVWDGENKSNNFGDLTNENAASKFILSKPDVFCNTSDREILSQVLNDFDQTTADFFRWEVNYTQDELSTLIKKRSGIDFGTIIDLIPQERGKSGRIKRLKIIGSKKSMTIGKELLIRKYLSESHLYSSAFVVKKTTGNADEAPSAYTLNGAGWGHGVGLCQIGAAVMSVKGFTHNKILAHYFPTSELKKLYI